VTELVSWSLTSLFSTNMAISETIFVTEITCVRQCSDDTSAWLDYDSCYLGCTSVDWTINITTCWHYQSVAQPHPDTLEFSLAWNSQASSVCVHDGVVNQLVSHPEWRGCHQTESTGCHRTLAHNLAECWSVFRIVPRCDWVSSLKMHCVLNMSLHYLVKLNMLPHYLVKLNMLLHYLVTYVAVFVSQ